jgi:hypothetical protein
MGKDVTEASSKSNSGEDEIIIRIKPTKIIAEKDIAEGE